MSGDHKASTRFRERVEALGTRDDLVGLSAAWSRGSGECASAIDACAVGLADRVTAEALTIEHRMPAGSVGKTFLGALALTLAEEGRVCLDASMRETFRGKDWIERLPQSDAITLRHLLTHTSGLIDHVFDDGWRAAARLKRVGPRADPDHYFEPLELVEVALRSPLLFEPGDGYHYTDTGFILGGLALERAAEVSFYDEVRRRFLEPLELRDTEPQLSRSFERLASGHLEPGNRFSLPERTAPDGVMVMNPRTEWTGGGFVSCATDLVQWARALYGGTVLGPRQETELLTSGFRDPASPTRYGIATVIRSTSHGPLLGHGGWFPGWRSMMVYAPDPQLALAFQINQDEPDHREDVLDQLLGALLDR